ncbi:MAG: hypothetical protein WC011_01410 [Candidatus Paceibacterota bacterium]
MKTFLKTFVSLYVVGFLLMNPFLAFAQSTLKDESTSSTSRSLGGLVPCGNDKDKDGAIINPCDFNYFLFMINKIINFILTVLALPLAAIAFAYAGFLLLFSGGQSSQREKAKSIFWNTAKGLIIIAACWLIISTILSVLGYDGAWIGF